MSHEAFKELLGSFRLPESEGHSTRRSDLQLLCEAAALGLHVLPLTNVRRPRTLIRNLNQLAEQLIERRRRTTNDLQHFVPPRDPHARPSARQHTQQAE
jgi:hypothetical protein